MAKIVPQDRKQEKYLCAHISAYACARMCTHLCAQKCAMWHTGAKNGAIYLYTNYFSITTLMYVYKEHCSVW